jgi:hypothetical protein
MNKLPPLYVSNSDVWCDVIKKRLSVDLTTISKLQPASYNRIWGSHSARDLRHSDSEGVASIFGADEKPKLEQSK